MTQLDSAVEDFKTWLLATSQASAATAAIYAHCVQQLLTALTGAPITADVLEAQLGDPALASAQRHYRRGWRLFREYHLTKGIADIPSVTPVGKAKGARPDLELAYQHYVKPITRLSLIGVAPRHLWRMTWAHVRVEAGRVIYTEFHPHYVLHPSIIEHLKALEPDRQDWTTGFFFHTKESPDVPLHKLTIQRLNQTTPATRTAAYTKKAPPLKLDDVRPDFAPEVFLKKA